LLVLTSPAAAQMYPLQAPGVMIGGGLKDQSPSAQAQYFSASKAAGATWVRVEYTWERTEPSPGVIDYTQTDRMNANAVANGLDTMALLFALPGWASSNGNWNGVPKDWNQWAAFVTRMVTRYKATVHHWEIWNEPDLGFWAGTPAQYAKLLAVAYDAIKAVDPTATVWFGGLSMNGATYPVSTAKTFLEACLNDPINPAGDKMDGVAWHIFATYMDRVAGWSDGIAASLAAKGLVKLQTVTEFGYPADPAWQKIPGYQSGEASQAEWLTDAFAQLASRGTVGGGSWAQLLDDQTSGTVFSSDGIYRVTGTTPNQVPGTPRTQTQAAMQAIGELARSRAP
jgi:hypothetical protein